MLVMNYRAINYPARGGKYSAADEVHAKTDKLIAHRGRVTSQTGKKKAVAKLIDKTLMLP